MSNPLQQESDASRAEAKRVSPATLRVRELRKRQRRGIRCFTIQLSKQDIEGLRARHYLAKDDTDPELIRDAVEAFVYDKLAEPMPGGAPRT